MSTVISKRKSDESEQLGPDHIKKAKDSELRQMQGAIAEIVEVSTKTLARLLDEPDSMDNWMVCLALQAIRYGQKETLESKIAAKKEKQVSFLRGIAEKILKKEFEEYVRNVENMTQKNSELSKQLKKTQKQLDEALNEQAKYIVRAENAEKEQTKMEQSKMDTVNPQKVVLYTDLVKLLPPTITTEPQPPQPKQPLPTKPTIIPKANLEWAEKVRTTRESGTDCHIIWGDHEILNQPEKMIQLLVEIVKETCKCENKDDCECHKKAVCQKARFVPGYKPAVIYITKSSTEIRNLLQKKMINDFSCGILDMRNRHWRQQLPTNFPKERSEEDEKYFKVFIKQVPEDLNKESIVSQLKDVLPEIVTGNRIFRGDKTPTSTVWLTFTDTSENKKAVDKAITERGVFLNNFRRPIELEKKTNILQCNKCQRIGHTQRNCQSKTANCRICAKDHQTKDHIKVQYENYKCYNCGLNHQANSLKCKKIVEAEKKKSQGPATKKVTNKTNNQQPTTKTAAKTAAKNPTPTPKLPTKKSTNTERKCYTCNKVGHIARNCPAKDNSSQNNERSSTQTRGGAKRREHNEEHKTDHNELMSKMLAVFMNMMPADYYKNLHLQRNNNV